MEPPAEKPSKATEPRPSLRDLLDRAAALRDQSVALRRQSTALRAATRELADAIQHAAAGRLPRPNAERR